MLKILKTEKHAKKLTIRLYLTFHYTLQTQKTRIVKPTGSNRVLIINSLCCTAEEATNADVQTP
jgi:hypothetical protein